MKWQPIETAPSAAKQRILLYNKKKKYTGIGFVLPNSKKCIVAGIGPMPMTHWQPLPEPPQDNE